MQLQSLESLFLISSPSFLWPWRVVGVHRASISSANYAGEVSRVWGEQPFQGDGDIFQYKHGLCHRQAQACKRVERIPSPFASRGNSEPSHIFISQTDKLSSIKMTTISIFSMEPGKQKLTLSTQYSCTEAPAPLQTSVLRPNWWAKQ